MSFLYKSTQNFSERTKYYNRIFQYLSAVISLFLQEMRLKIAQNRPFSFSFIIFKMKKNSVILNKNLFPNASFAKEEVCLSWSFEDQNLQKYNSFS